MKRVPSIVVLALLLAGCGSDESDGVRPISDRVVKLEAEVKAIREEMSAMRPAIERLVQVESDIRQVVEDLKMLAEAPAPASAAPQPVAAAPAPPAPQTPAPQTPAPSPAPAPAAASPPIQPAPPVETPPVEAPSPAPARPDVPVAAAPSPSAPSLPAAQPAQVQQPAVLPAAATAPPAGGLAIHLASYGSRETAARGWRSLQARYPALLGTLSAVVAPIQTDRGATLLRLKAGPLTTDAEVARLCEAIRQRGDFCSPETFDGSPLAALREVSGRTGATQRAAVAPTEQVAGR